MDAITACLAAAGRAAGTPLALGPSRDAGWIQVEAGTATVACTIAAIEGVRGPVVLALATWPAAIHDAGGNAVRLTGYGAQATGADPGPAAPGDSTTAESAGPGHAGPATARATADQPTTSP
jgi:hypothetical protein